MRFLLPITLAAAVACSSPALAFVGAGRPQARRRTVPTPTRPSPTPPPAALSQPPPPGGTPADETPRERPKVIPQLRAVQAANQESRRIHNVKLLQDEYEVDGSDVAAAIFDEGPVLYSHKEFRRNLADVASSRVLFRQQIPTRFKQHATHVAGTIAASGVKPSAKGMAPALKELFSENWDGDLDKLDNLSSRVRISNHSYTPAAGWGRNPWTGGWIWWGDEAVDANEDANFGKYTDREARLDSVLYGSKKLLTFAAAGNDRDDGPETAEIPDTQPVPHQLYAGKTIDGDLLFTDVTGRSHNIDGFDRGGLDTVAGLCVAKNAICVGAIGSTTGAAGLVSFSAWGPTDDGRIKPDLVANGLNVLSTAIVDEEPMDDTGREGSYNSEDGTSMASPTAAGIASLLVQLFLRSRERDPFASEIKAVMIHTATEMGEPGPDPKFGWGSVDALRAGHVIAKRLDDGGFRHVLEYFAVSRQNPTRVLLLEPNGTTDPIRATLVWTDPPGAANREGLDDPSLTLQNDLDVRLVAPDGTVYYPYSLDPGEPLRPARRGGPNRVDNVEVIDGAGALPGPWKLEVTATSLRVGSRQDFAVVVSGLRVSQ